MPTQPSTSCGPVYQRYFGNDRFPDFKKDEPRVVIFNLKFSIQTSDGTIQPKNKVLVISWVPNGLSGMKGLKLKMLATSAVNSVKDSFQIGIGPL